MKFVTKYSNYLLVLRSSRPAVPAIGQPSVPGISIRSDGDSIVKVEDEEICKMVMESNAFKRKDIILIEEGGDDPYKSRRTPIEPEHNILVLEHGAIAQNINPKSKIVFTPEQKKIINDMVSETAKEMAKEMAGEMAKEMLKGMAGKVAEEQNKKKQDNKVVADIVQEETKKKPGRPPKNKEDNNEKKIDLIT